MEMDSNMLIELAILTSCLFVAILVWAWLDSKQEKRLLQSIELENHHPLNKRHTA